jgi:hypothetical protein
MDRSNDGLLLFMSQAHAAAAGAVNTADDGNGGLWTRIGMIGGAGAHPS